jgi:hypothetical protein
VMADILVQMAKQSRDELVGYLREQMGFLRRSAEAFDEGEESTSDVWKMRGVPAIVPSSLFRLRQRNCACVS